MKVWFVVVSLIDPTSGYQTLYRDRDPFELRAECMLIAQELNARFLREDRVGVSRCESVIR